MKNLAQYTMMILASCLIYTTNAQMAFNNPLAFGIVSAIEAIDIHNDAEYEMTVFDKESTQDYLPFAAPIFTATEGEEDISNFLPFAEPLFGANTNDEYLPIEENNGYFIESHNYTQSEFVVFSDKSFNEIIISLDSEEERQIEITLFNAYGKQILAKNSTTTKGINDINIEINNLISGLYSMVIKSNNESLHKKFIIK